MEGLQQLIQLVQDIRDLLNPTGWVVQVVTANLGTLVDSFRVFVLTTGDPIRPSRPFSQGDVVQRFEPLVRAAADAGLVLLTMSASYHVMWSNGIRNRYQVRMLLPRLLLAVGLINFALPLFQATVDLNNALVSSVLAAGLPIDWTHLFDIQEDLGTGPGLTLVVTAALFAGYLLLAFVYVVRYALLVVLAILAPLAALLFVLPETHRYAREWASLLVTTLFMQPLQLLIISIGFGLENSGSWPIRHCFALAALFITFKVPGALHTASSVGTHATTTSRRRLVKLAHAAMKAA